MADSDNFKDLPKESQFLDGPTGLSVSEPSDFQPMLLRLLGASKTNTTVYSLEKGFVSSGSSVPSTSQTLQTQQKVEVSTEIQPEMPLPSHSKQEAHYSQAATSANKPTINNTAGSALVNLSTSPQKEVEVVNTEVDGDHVEVDDDQLHLQVDAVIDHEEDHLQVDADIVHEEDKFDTLLAQTRANITGCMALADKVLWGARQALEVVRNLTMFTHERCAYKKMIADALKAAENTRQATLAAQACFSVATDIRSARRAVKFAVRARNLGERSLDFHERLRNYTRVARNAERRELAKLARFEGR